MTVRTVLFIHNNFPAQYRHLAATLASRPGYRVVAFGSPTARSIAGVQLLRYPWTPQPESEGHSFGRRFNAECRRAEEIMYLATELQAEGVEPDVIFVHPGWGEGLPLRPLFPNAKIIAFCEFYYHPVGKDVGFDQEFLRFGLDGEVRVHVRNATMAMALADADLGIAPTEWQRSLFPPIFQPNIEVVHDGIDVDAVRPNPDATLILPNGSQVRAGDKVVTYVARNLEPYRGFHVFMRALPRVLAAHPDAQVVIVGGSDVSYGARPEDGSNWRDLFVREIEARADLSRVHFMGVVPRPTFLDVLQVSAAHIYLTYPFVLSWSLTEAMAAECLIIGSDTPPVREAIAHGQTGLLVPFFEPDLLGDTIIRALDRPDLFWHMKRAAREVVVRRYSVAKCVARQIELMESLLGTH
ncbi:glycosyltransferase [Aquabacter sp. L1I39]|uniref:glycosyltransferase n=1 Tax=Aquabacter sp. L1I39 TaxID=2820278 RepID=UPI001ADB626F|nr:glycosyltransferase [Aquabacter sp. L1I39]QTL05811.1 glycosyltransferase [Aquabacter sp. L1I39]